MATTHTCASESDGRASVDAASVSYLQIRTERLTGPARLSGKLACSEVKKGGGASKGLSYLKNNIPPFKSLQDSKRVFTHFQTLVIGHTLSLRINRSRCPLSIRPTHPPSPPTRGAITEVIRQKRHSAPALAFSFSLYSQLPSRLVPVPVVAWHHVSQPPFTQGTQIRRSQVRSQSPAAVTK